MDDGCFWPIIAWCQTDENKPDATRRAFIVEIL
jgi:hypothetical protein